MVTEKTPNYTCTTCDFITDNKKDYEKHKMTAKHKKRTLGDSGDKKNPAGHCDFCNKFYKSRNGLWKHIKMCALNKTKLDGVPSESILNTIICDNTQFKNNNIIIINIIIINIIIININTTMRVNRLNINYASRNNVLPALARLSPMLIVGLMILNLIVLPSYTALYLCMAFSIVFLSNWVFKYVIFKPLYSVFGQKHLSLFGIGERPVGANSCSFLLDGVTDTSFGMPSGHSQGAWALATYLLLHLLKPNASLIWKSMSCLLVVLSAAYISYSRVYIEGCHTIEQVMVGGVLGVISGVLIFSFEERGVHYIKNKISIYL